MITLLAGILSFLSASFPHILNYYKDKQDKVHELASYDKQIQLEKLRIHNQLEAIKVETQSAEVQTIHLTDKPTGTWTDSLNATVRPVLCYAIFALYAWSKWVLYQQMLLENPDLNFLIETFHDNEDMALVMSAIGFYFGNRYFEKKFS